MAARKRKLPDLFEKEIDESIILGVTRQMIPIREITPESVKNFIRVYAKAHQTAPSLLLSALLTSTATCLGSRTRTQIFHHNPDHTLTSNIFLIGAAKTGSGKGPAYTKAILEPLRFVEKEHDVKLMITNCTLTGLLHIFDKNGGQGLVTSAAMVNTLNKSLKRSAIMEDPEEWINLKSTWDGGRLTKDDTCIRASAVTVSGLTYPYWILDLLSEPGFAKDGLWQRMLVWCLPMADRRMECVSRACKNLRNHYPNLQSLASLMSGIYKAAHGKEDLKFHFSTEAEDFLGGLYDRCSLGIALHYPVERNPKRPPPQFDGLEPLVTPCGVKFVDHVVKISTCMHVLYTTLDEHISQDSRQLELEIPKSTVLMAHNLVLHIQQQMEHLEESAKAGYLVPLEDELEADITGEPVVHMP